MEERIIEILKVARNNGMSKRDVYKKLAYTNLSFEDFEEIFEDMKSRHLIYQTGKDSYTKNPFVEGEVIVTKSGNIFVKTEEGKVKITDDQFNCVNGDKVNIRITDFNELKGTIKSIVDRKGISAELKTVKGKRYAVTKDGKEYRIDVSPKIVDETIIGITIEKDRKSKEPIAVLNKVIGHKNRPQIDEQTILYENNFNFEWSDEVLKELDYLPSEVLSEELKGRRDLRSEIIFTIDGDDTKDIDDAISLEKLSNGNFRLGVHIADVSHYVKEGSEIDKEAYSRATSVYMHNVVNPMYPTFLSNGICSLNPEVDRLAMSCEMEISPSGKLVSFDVFESVIHSRKQMTYKNVNKILEENEIPEGYEEYADTLKEMQNLAEILRKDRIRRGYQNFDLPEIKVVTEEGKVTEILRREQKTAEELIEIFMLAANETVATYVNSIGVPFIYRDHDVPNEEKLRKVTSIITNYGDQIAVKGKVASPKYIQNLLKEIEKTSRKEVYSNMILRCLAKATYEAYNIGHFSIGINGSIGEAYTHFTSPIRRYPDTTVHRVLKLILRGKLENLYNDAFKTKIAQIAKHSSTQELNADKCERESNKMKLAEYMEDFIDEEYDAMIISFTNGGMFVQLTNLIEGRVGYESMDDFYNYDPDLEMLIGEKTKKVYKLGDKVKVKLVRASKELREIDFEILKEKGRTRKIK